VDRDYFQSRPHGQWIGFLVLFGFLMLMLGNHMVSLTHPDEVFYTQTAKEMVAHNSWLTPLIFDHPQFEKPILFYWLLALGIKLFGVTPFVARFWPAFFGIGGLCVTYWIAWMFFGRKRLAFLSGIILGSSFIYLALSRAVLTDMVFSIWVIVALAFFCFAYTRREYKSLGIILAFFFSAMAVLTKGALGFLFPCFIILLFLIWQKDLGFLKDRSCVWGLVVFLLTALPWHIAMVQLYGRVFIEEYIHNVHIRRLFEAEHPKIDTWYFYFQVMFGGILPWSFFLFPAGHWVGKQFQNRSISCRSLSFLICWIIGIYLFMQPVHSKLASYIFPVFPAMAILVAYYLDHVLEKNPKLNLQQGFSVCAYATCVLMSGAAIAAIIFGNQYSQMVVSKWPVYVFSGLSLLSALMIFIFNRKKQFGKVICSYLGINITLLAVLFMARPFIEPWVSCKGICDIFKKIDQSGATVLTSKFYVRGIRFYTDREMAVIDISGKGFFSPHPVLFLNTDQMVLDFLERQGVTYAIVKEGNVEDLKRILAGQPYRLEELEGMGGKYILRIEKI